MPCSSLFNKNISNFLNKLGNIMTYCENNQSVFTLVGVEFVASILEIKVIMQYIKYIENSGIQGIVTSFRICLCAVANATAATNGGPLNAIYDTVNG
ncbi:MULTISPECIES: hypothetical protein [Acidithiobacillus]|jgi:hypothetical protein|uniref:hypothetical protein n=1 Tax=Acidithiobacillus TaxID=119977 RepID=UPI000FACDBB7|nr:MULTISPECIES: hypothetical protein [Acidithiobacillus]MCL5956529.1 hypothetical protein [Gammaproteobacteria bacterium]MBN6745875.1 hypothetical protein [Acidithiobacillus sp. MC2.2]MBN6748815.1 hypothetical protein [Acidithiobacillus sp. PG05]MBU2775565.1 hypothetical protein [Acidithiobacillus ferrooxidans]MCR0968667.1 hypothetical protein [Acidithiobacillus ferrooxidans]